MSKESVTLRSAGERLAGTLFLPEGAGGVPAMIICHGAGEFKENYFELAGVLASKGVATLAVDLRGHGESNGERFHVNIADWVADIQAAIDFLVAHPKIDGAKIGAMGLSSGGTAILEAAVVDPRLKVLVALDATVRNSLPLPLAATMKIFVGLGHIKKFFTKKDLRIPLSKLGGVHLASDPEVERQLRADPRLQAAGLAFPFPGAAAAFFVDTIKRVSKITAPTLVLWGADDKLDPVETGKQLLAALTCKKQLHIIPGNGHMGHMDRNKAQVFALTTGWVLENFA